MESKRIENEAALACLRIEDNEEAFACLKRLIQEWPSEDTCKPSLVLLVQEGCDPCDEEQSQHAEAIEAGIVQVVDFNSPRGIEIAEKNGIEAVPAVLVLDCYDMAIEE